MDASNTHIGAVTTSHPISSAISFTSSAMGISDVPAVKIPILPPVLSILNPFFLNTAIPALSFSCKSALLETRLLRECTCPFPIRLTMTLPLPSIAFRAILTTSSGVFPSARMISGIPVRTSRFRSSFARSATSEIAVSLSCFSASSIEIFPLASFSNIFLRMDSLSAFFSITAGCSGNTISKRGNT